MTLEQPGLGSDRKNESDRERGATCNVSYSIHTVAFLHCICTGTSHLVGCECMVGKLTLRMVFDWVGSVNGTMSNRVTRLIEMIKKICAGYQQEGIDSP